MKNIFYSGLLGMIFLSSCSHHTVASNSTIAPVNNNAKPTPASVYTKPVVVVDAHGNIIADAKDLPPTADKSILNEQNARGYTPEQTKNLAYRYKYVPPKILFVPDVLSKSSNRGVYYVYKTKFWYWKNQNGYYYLDETYYN